MATQLELAEPLRPFSPAFSFLEFSLADLVEEVRAAWFPQLAGPVPVFFVEWEPLACAIVSGRGGRLPAVYIHQVLNHPATPEPVLRAMVKHELLHFVVPPGWKPHPRRRFQVPTDHPEAFWDEEERIAPETPYMWAWVGANLKPCLFRYYGEEGVKVSKKWRRLELSERTPWIDSELQFPIVYEWQLPKRSRRRRW